jgi:putative MATE family efflux protein
MSDLTKGNVAGVILKFAIPMLLGNVFQQLYSIVDAVIVGKFLGKDALAAVGASYPIIFTIIALVIGIGSGASVVISQYFGAKDFDKVRRAIDTVNIFLLFTGVGISVIGIASSRWLFTLLQLPEELMEPAVTYLNIYLMGMVVFFGFNGTTSILRGIGDSKTPLYFLIIATIVNIGLDLLFVVVFKWGIAGAAWATVISQVGAFATAILYLNRSHNLIRFAIRGLTFDWEIFRQSIRIGLPTGIQQTFVALGMMALMGIVNTFGTNVIAGYTAAGRIDSIAGLPAMSISMALSVFVGQNLGAGRVDRIRKGLNSSLQIASIISIVTTVCAILWSEPLMKIFTTDPNVIEVGKEYLIIVSLFYVVFSTMFVFNGLLRGAGATLIPMFVTLFSLWLIRIPLAWFLSKHIGVQGIWWSIPIAWFIGMVCSYIYYKMGKWKDKAVVKGVVS